MYLLDEISIGDKVKVTYRPIPYLGMGIVDSITIEGKLSAIKTVKGISYIVLVNDEDLVIFERNLREIENIAKVSSEVKASNTPMYTTKTK